MQNYKAIICYDGTNYKGWQKQTSTEKTIQGRLEKILSDILDEAIEIHGSGRTDAGVHAIGQVISFKTSSSLSAQDISKRLRHMLPSDIGLISLEKADIRFHARLSCTGKTYIYRIWNSEEPCIFERKYAHIIPSKLDLDLMKKASLCFIGTHDFSAFCTKKSSKHSAERTIEKINISKEGNIVQIEYTGNGFLYNMVRIMTGTLIDIGLEKRNIDSINEAFVSNSRINSGETAPACGLFLKEVYYTKK